MAKFRKKPVVIEAVLATEAISKAFVDWSDLPQWFVEAYDNNTIVFQLDGILIRTLEGDMKANPTDWIIKGVNGEFYPCKPDIFEKTYEAVV